MEKDPGSLGVLVRHPMVTGIVLLILATTVGVIVWQFDSGRQPTEADLDIVAELDRVTETLAARLRDQWWREEALRLVDRPVPLPVRWVNAPDPLVAPWSHIRRDPHEHAPLVLADSLDHVVDVFRRVPSRRLVVLGKGGSGKTVLTIRFMLSLLPGSGERLAGRPLPVLFSLASWNPESKPLRSWLEDELIAAHPSLARQLPGGQSTARELLTHGRVLFVLDGLDEMASHLRGEALKALSESLQPADEVLVTSRIPEYRAAVGQAGPLAEAAVVMIEDLKVSDLAAYLGAQPVTAGQRSPWLPVLAELAGADAGPGARALRDVLTTPLMVFMARIVYQVSGKDPQELLRLGGSAEIRAYLFERFVPAAFDPGPGVRATARARRRVNRAERYLRFLAAHLVDLGVLNFRWWQLYQGLKKRDRTLLGVDVGVAAIGLLVVLVSPFGLLTSTLDGLSLGALLGFLTGYLICRPTVFGKPISPVPARIRRRTEPSTRDNRVHPPVRRFVWRFSSLVGLTGGAVWALTEIQAGPIAAAGQFLVVTIATAVPTAFAAWFATRLAEAVEEPVALARALGPGDLLRLDRAVAGLEAVLCGLAAAVFGGVLSPVLSLSLFIALNPDIELSHIDFGSVVLLPMVETPAVVVFLLLFLLTAWGRFTLARCYFALTGRLPWRLMAFLDEAHKRGILRQAGAVYQFRHLEIRNQLARQRDG